MIIFNTTYHVENGIEEDFIKYLKEEFIPAAVASKVLAQPRLTRVVTQESQEGSSLAMQFEVEDIEKLEDWYDETGNALNEGMVMSFGSKIVGFSTLLEQIDL